ncbi:hypothetical protein BRADI_1g25281v3 [Brachypodium distachyon]|uniref:Uncharacterized protein n=1 Tax=Brachypodium distachyon TaxID=15368 RepID=A0A0Q3NEU9_BRADI|nr:hypothetical protein BRADI_1g25281v3 [Brachypodium distachyon]
MEVEVHHHRRLLFQMEVEVDHHRRLLSQMEVEGRSSDTPRSDLGFSLVFC